MIYPTIGRVVWFTPTEIERTKYAGPKDQLLAAIVTYVWHDKMVNLLVATPNGETFGQTSVTLVQDGDPYPVDGFCQWMPYQKGQAAKYDALAAEKK
jgi:hypothetical protein